MCGIFAYLNHLTPKTRQEILKILFLGLNSLESRGYDSAGIAIDGEEKNKIILIKKAGKLELLKKAIDNYFSTNASSTPLETHLALGHTRWASHGEVNDLNAHPQSSDSDNEFVVVHNGIITNSKEIKKYLQSKGYEFKSETDTEVIVKLLKHFHSVHKEEKPTFAGLVEGVVHYLEGAYALVFKSWHYPGEVVVTRKGSPLMIGVKSQTKLSTDRLPIIYNKSLRGSDSFCNLNLNYTRQESELSTLTPVGGKGDVEYIISSDLSAILTHTNRVIYLEDNDVASVGKTGKLSIHRLDVRGEEVTLGSREVSLIRQEIQEISKNGFKTFMEKEIYEQPESIMNTMRGRVHFDDCEVTLGGLKSYIKEIMRCRRLLIIASGSSFHSAVAARQLIEELTELSLMVDLSSDFIDRKTPIFRDDVCIFLSQSGETADTLQALRYCKSRGSLILGVTNTVGSSICRESNCGIHINAGPEVGVASTKTYTSQYVSLVLFALVMSQDKISLTQRRNQIIKGLQKLPEQITKILKMAPELKKLAEELKDKRSLLFIGRGFNFATCLEGALKIKELTYMHSEGIMAGELKHGPLALVDESMPMIIINTKNNVYQKCMNAIQQVTARQGNPIVFCNEDDEEVEKFSTRVFKLPSQVDCLQGVLTIIPMQLLALHIAELKNFNVDQPRNLLKHYSETE